MTDAAVDQLALVLGVADRVIGAVGDEQWTYPTPCAEWNVRELVSHLINGNRMFAGILSSAASGAPRETLAPGSDLLSAYRDSSDRLLAAFRQPGVLERIVAVPFGSVPGAVALHLRITEVLVHGWDLARATGQRVEFPDDLVEQELAFSRSRLSDIPPERRPFAPPQPVAGDAAPIDRLAACLGRTVTETAPDGDRSR